MESGDEVKVGEKIGECNSTPCAPVHATVSGEVVGVEERLCPVGEEIKSVIIESDGKDDWVDTEGIDWKNSSQEDLISKIKECGVVGLGGAAFPTWMKLSPPDDKDIDTLILNGAECEPFLTSDHSTMLEEAEKVLEGIKILDKILEVDRVVVGIEENKEDAIEKMEELSGGKIEVAKMETKYPQGDERIIIKSLTGREIPADGLPHDIGVAVQNVGTVKAVQEAVVNGKPLVERNITVSGDVEEPKNFSARIGTKFTDLIEESGGVSGDIGKVISGGPMMGNAEPKDVPVIKGTTSVLVFNDERISEEEERPCIRCGRCVNVCPMGLMPFKLKKLAEAEKAQALIEHHVDRCDECGSCAYTCPSKIPLVEKIAEGKKIAGSEE